MFIDAEKVPAIYKQSTSNEKELEVHSVIYCPRIRNWIWFITEKDPETGMCFGYACSDFAEYGYFDLDEMIDDNFEFLIHPKFKPGMTMQEAREIFKEELHGY